MIITIIATALIQCVARTHPGWMTVTADGMARSSLAARLDIFIPRLFLSRGRYPSIRQALPVRYCNPGYVIDVSSASRSRKSEPGCPGSLSPFLLGDRQERRCYEGISTVSTTWMTPLD